MGDAIGMHISHFRSGKSAAHSGILQEALPLTYCELHSLPVAKMTATSNPMKLLPTIQGARTDRITAHQKPASHTDSLNAQRQGSCKPAGAQETSTTLSLAHLVSIPAMICGPGIYMTAGKPLHNG